MNESADNATNPKSPANPNSYPKFGKRHILAIWLFTGFINVYILRVSINVAIVSMVNNTAIAANHSNEFSNETCPFPKAENGSSANSKEGDFDWNHETQGLILSSFYYGYICTQFVGGYLARLIGARLLYGIGVGGTALLTLFNPIAARTSPGVLIAVRVVEGLLEGVTFPSSHFLLGNWAPKNERTLLVSFPLSGPFIGTVISAPLTGLLCEYGFDGGWASSFYVFGGISLLWCLGWFYFIRDSPAQHPTISREERAYIEEQCQSSKTVAGFREVPWQKIATSPCVWAIIVAHTCFNWNFYTLLTEISTYLKDVLHIGASLNGIVSSIPYICLWICQLISAYISDSLRARGFKTKNVRKICYCFGMTSSAGFLISIGYAGCDTTLVIVLLCLSVGMVGFAQNFIVNHVDIAPQFASILMGITNTFATLPGILSPILTGDLTNQQSTTATWQTVFYISAGFSLFGSLFYGILADGEVQSWAKPSNDLEAIVNAEDNSVQKRSPGLDDGEVTIRQR